MRSHRPAARLASALLAPALLALAACTPTPPAVDPVDERPDAADIRVDLAELEAQYDARIGVVAIDTGSGETAAWRADERFAYASTIKAVAAGLVLAEVGVDGLDEPVAIPTELVDYSPVTEQHAGGELPLGDVAAAAVQVSDNTAGNLLFERLGGIGALREALAGVDDEVTMPARVEPDLNEAAPGDDRDTSTPRALAATLRALALDEDPDAALAPAEREQLVDWLVGSTTGDALVRAGLPETWRVGDKSGAAGFGTRNDIAIAWPDDGGAPIVVAVLTTREVADAEYDDAVVADAARLAVEALER